MDPHEIGSTFLQGFSAVLMVRVHWEPARILLDAPGFINFLTLVCLAISISFFYFAFKPAIKSNQALAMVVAVMFSIALIQYNIGRLFVVAAFLTGVCFATLFTATTARQLVSSVPFRWRFAEIWGLSFIAAILVPKEIEQHVLLGTLVLQSILMFLELKNHSPQASPLLPIFGLSAVVLTFFDGDFTRELLSKLPPTHFSPQCEQYANALTTVLNYVPLAGWPIGLVSGLSRR